MNHDSNNNEPSVLLTEMPKVDDKYNDEELVAKWDRIYEIRESILVDIEKARAEKTVGHPLDAMITITTKGNDYEFMKDLSQVLEMILIVSKVKIEEGEEKKVVVEKAPGYKCARCWKYDEDIGRDKHNPDICPRCIENTK